MMTKTMLKKVMCAVLIGCTVLGAAGCGSNSSEDASSSTKKVSSLEEIKKKGELVVAIETNYPPYDFVDTSKSGKTMTGIDVALSEAIAKKIGVKAKIVDSNFSSLLASVSSGKVDLGMSGMTATEERAKSMDFSDPYINSKYIVIVRKDDLNKFSTIDDFNNENTKIGIEKSTTAVPVAAEDMPKAKTVVLDQIPDLLMELKQNKIDGFIVDEVIAQQYLLTNPDIVISPVVLQSPKAKMDTVVSAGNGRDNTELMKIVNEVIKEERDNGNMQKWIQEYSQMSVQNAKQ